MDEISKTALNFSQLFFFQFVDRKSANSYNFYIVFSFEKEAKSSVSKTIEKTDIRIKLMDQENLWSEWTISKPCNVVRCNCIL